MTLNREERLKLTDREFQIAKLVEEGKQVNDIAEELMLSIKTIKNNIAKIKKKIGNRFQKPGYSEGKTARGVPALLNTKKCKSYQCEFSDEEKAKWDQKKSGKELFFQDKGTGKNSMAFNMFGKGERVLSEDGRLACAISNLSERGYLLKKRAESRKTMLLSTKHKVLRLKKSEINAEVKEVLKHQKLTYIKKDLPGLSDGDTAIYDYCCKSDHEFNALLDAAIGIPVISYDDKLKSIVITYDKQVSVMRVVIKKAEGGESSVLKSKDFSSAGCIFEIETALELNKLYEIVIELTNSAVLSYKTIFK